MAKQDLMMNFQHDSIKIFTKDADKRISEPFNKSDIPFGEIFSDHMLMCEWDNENGWKSPEIRPYKDIPMSPASTCLHYASQCFEGLKAYYSKEDGKIRLFRPMENMKRMILSAEANSLPEIDGEELLKCIKHLIKVDEKWVPRGDGCSLYIRPVMLGVEPFIGVRASKTVLLYCITCPVGPYFKAGFQPISLYADPKYIRAWKGGVGDRKVAGNYAPSIRVQKEAKLQGCQEVLWLLGDDHHITEIGTMNVFICWINKKGETELVTPPLDGTILPGVTRQSVLDLARTWDTLKVDERRITMKEIHDAVKEKRIKEMFGTGTACVVQPVDRILYNGENILIPIVEDNSGVATRCTNQLSDIQYGRIKHEWADIVPI